MVLNGSLGQVETFSENHIGWCPCLMKLFHTRLRILEVACEPLLARG